MNKMVSLLILFLFLCVPVSAGTVDLEIWENSEGVFFITVDNGELQECNGSVCVVEIENVTATTLSLSDGDIKYIAEYTSTQLEIDGFKPYGYDLDDNVLNETEMRAIFWDIVAEKQADERAFITRTWMPAVEDYNNMSLELGQTQGAINTLNAQFQGHAAVVESKDITIGVLEREATLKDSFIIILFFGCAILLLERSEFVRQLREWREK